MKIAPKKLIYKTAFLIFTLILYTLLPTLEISQPWPYSQLPGAVQLLLGYSRIWIARPAICFAVVFLVLHFVSAAVSFPAGQNRTCKRIFMVLTAVLILSLVYWIGGSLAYMAPMPPMSFTTWVAVFAKSRICLYCWWGLTAVCLHLAIEF